MPPKTINLIGNKIGRLTVIRELEHYRQPNGKTVRVWECQCECGTIKPVRQDILTRGNTISCGCYHQEEIKNRPYEDLTGQNFGKWKVLYEVGIRKKSDGSSERVWHCKCSCEFGTEKDIPTRSLKTRGGCMRCARRKPNLKARKTNTYDLSGEYGIGYDSNGNEFWFDLEDYDKIKDYCWIKSTGGYFIAPARNGDKSSVKLHRIILDLCDEDSYRIVPDHIGGKESRFDNRKSNIRIATGSQNKFNIPPRSNSSTGVTGVCWSNSKNKWRAYINLNGKQIHIGYFDDINDAISARKNKEEEMFKEFSYDNSQKIANDYKEKK